MSRRTYEDLEAHLSRELQDTFRRHLKVAEIVLAPKDVLNLMLVCAANLSCCALSSAAASIVASSEDDPEGVLDDTLTAFIEVLASLHDVMLVEIKPAVAAAKAQAR